MSDTDKYDKLTREDLYELVWAKPGSQLSTELGVSDVAIAKRCRKLNVPRPSRGYWAKIAAGRTPRKMPLPPAGEVRAAKVLRTSVGKTLPLPDSDQKLHRVAVELQSALATAKPDSDKRLKISDRTLPKVTVTQALVSQVIQTVHVIIHGVEWRGVPFRKSRSRYDSGYFEQGSDRLHLELEEALVEKPVEPTGRKERYSTYNWRKSNQVPSGLLSVSVNPDSYGSGKLKRWTHDGNKPLGDFCAQVVREICEHFADLAEQRAREAAEAEKRRVEHEERWKKQQEEEKVQKRKQLEHEHPGKLRLSRERRMDDLVKAAEWWRLHSTVCAFIDACEQHWHQQSEGALTPEQEQWLVWAREASREMSPHQSGYPNPSEDGPFDAASVPVGGPYPEHRDLPNPPTMPKIPAPVVQSGYAYQQEPAPKPYPFWLRYPRR